MRIDPFGLERWFAEYEHEADIMLAESGIRSLDASRFDLDRGRLDYVIPTNGDPDFRDSVGKRYGRSADEVLFTCGTQEEASLRSSRCSGTPRDSKSTRRPTRRSAPAATPSSSRPRTKRSTRSPRRSAT